MSNSAAFDWVVKPLGKIQGWWSADSKWDAFARELDNAGDDGARILQELRLNGGDLRRLMAASEADALLLGRMMAALGIDAQDVVRPGVMRDLERVCASCDSKGLCRRDLDNGEAVASWAGYCPNHATLSAVQAVALSRRE